MLTAAGEKMAESRHQFMVDFFERLNKEVDGEL
jgi:HD superfamily phosphodiesterase